MDLSGPAAAATVFDRLAGWTPVRVHLSAGRPVVEWCHTRGIDFDDPFFDESVERCLRHPFRLLFRQRTSIEELVERSRHAPGLPPAGFVFHGSRCGSTLVMQMLGALPSTLCLSEAAPIDTVLRAAALPGVPPAAGTAWLRAMVSALSQPRGPGHRHAVVKVDAWSVLDLRLIRSAFPDVPWVFVYRDPVEVLVSQLRRRGYHMIPGALPPGVLGLGPDDVRASTPEAFAATVLRRIYRAGLEGHVPGRSLLVNHHQLPDAVGRLIAPHFGIDTGGGAEAMQRAAGRNAKNPVLAYEDDRAAKQHEATAAVRAAARLHVADVYDALESARAAG